MHFIYLFLGRSKELLREKSEQIFLSTLDGVDVVIVRITSFAQAQA
jgi:hypothetical protein